MSAALICKCTVFLMLSLKAFSVPLPECSGPQIFLHPDMFKDNYCNVTPKDVAAFKFFCIFKSVSSIVNQYIEILSLGVSDNLHKNLIMICVHNFIIVCRMRFFHLMITLVMLQEYARNMLALRHTRLCYTSYSVISM